MRASRTDSGPLASTANPAIRSCAKLHNSRTGECPEVSAIQESSVALNAEME